MPRRPALTVTESPKGFLVHVPASLSLRGKLERRYFKRSEDAESFAAKLRTAYHKGVRGGVVGMDTAQAASAAEKALKTAGLKITVMEVVRAYIDARAILDPLQTTLPEVCKAWQTKYKAKGSDRTFGEAAAAFIKDQEMSWSDRYQRNIEQTVKALPAWFLATKMPEIDENLMMKATKESVTTPTAIETSIL